MTAVSLRCAVCAADLPEGARFCPECGSPAKPASCPSCGAPAGAGKFCAECGSPLAPPAARVGGAPTTAAPVAERRVTSVLFGDLVSFTSLSETRDPEEVRELLSGYFTQARIVVERYGGMVEKFIGDAVMAVWGVPTAHEDDAERAVRAGLDLVAAISAMGEEVGAPHLAMRVGVVTGEVAVTLGAIGEGMVAGDAVNTAARVQASADPGAVWVDDATRSLTSAAVAYSDAGEHALKGKSEPVRLHRARAVIASVGGAQRVDGLEAPFTGRDRELRLVKELFHSTEEDGRARLAVVSGVAGVGKSRLGWEFEKYIDGVSDLVRWHRGRCLSYGEGVAFWALAEAVRGRLGLGEGDSPDVVDDHLEQGLQRWVPDAAERAWIGPRLGVLIGTSATGTFARQDLFAAWTAFFEHVGDDAQAVVLRLDDAQYADDGLLDFVDHLLDTARFPVFVLALARRELAERRPGFGSGRRSTTVHLEPLSERAMGNLVDGLVDGLPAAALAALVERAEGVPLYAVETVRALIDRDAVVPRDGRYVLATDAGSRVDLATLGAPASLQALVASRLDALAPAERRVIQAASVLGTSFTRPGLEALVDDGVGLDDVLAALVRKEVIYVQNDRLSAERGQYRFVQAVVRQVAYDTMARRERKARHLAVARHLADQPDAAEDLAAVIAQHHLDAVDASAPDDADVPDLIAVARERLARAAARAEALGAPAEALRHYVSALARTEEPPERASLEQGAARAALAAGAHQEAQDHAERATAAYDAAGDLVAAGRSAAIQAQALVNAQELTAGIGLLEPRWRALADDPGAAGAVLAMAECLAQAHTWMGDIEAARFFGDRALRLAEATGDPARLVLALSRYGVIWCAIGASTAGIALLEASVALARAHHLGYVLSRPLLNIAAFQMTRDLPVALAAGREAVAVSQQTGNANDRIFAVLNLSVALRLAGHWAELRQLLVEHRTLDVAQRSTASVQEWWLARDTGTESPDLVPFLAREPSPDLLEQAWWAHAALAEAQGRGDLAGAARFGERAVRHSLEASGLDDDFAQHWIVAVEAALEAGQLPLAERLLTHVTDAPAGLVTPYLRAELPRLRGLVGAAAGAPQTSVEQDLRGAITALQDFGAVPDRARTELALAELLQAWGRVEEADPLLASARATFTELGATRWLARAATVGV